ncbi:MAG: histidine triad protein [Actinomycetia bacterium]|nr:histidine triad protein [Actinomycetes bacterium]
MSLDHLWAGWRMPYIESAGNGPPSHAADGCVLCRLAAATDDREAMVLARTEHMFVVMNAYPYTSGHIMVAPLEHVADLDALSLDAAGELTGLLQDSVRAERAAYDPAGFNVGANLGVAAGAGIPGHLHFHVVPRWGGDTNFMTSIADARVLPEALGASYEKLRAAWPS